MRIVTVLAAGLLLQGCATIVEGTGQNVTVATNPPGATCTVDRAGMRLGMVTPTPGSLHIQKSKNDLNVTCELPGHRTESVSQSPNFVATTIGNVLVGGLVGVVVDAASGANFKYPGEVKLDLAPDVPRTVEVTPTQGTVPMS